MVGKHRFYASADQPICAQISGSKQLDAVFITEPQPPFARFYYALTRLVRCRSAATFKISTSVGRFISAAEYPSDIRTDSRDRIR